MDCVTSKKIETNILQHPASSEFRCLLKIFSNSLNPDQFEPRSVLTGHVAQSVMCLATDACLTADPGVARSILARSQTFVEIGHEINSTVILLPSAESFKKGCCQLQAKVCAQSTR